MIWIKSTGLLAIVLASITAYGDPIYKWTDENGRVHYGDSTPKSQKNVAKNINLKSVSITESMHQETETRNAKDKGQSSQINKLIESKDSRVEASDSAQVNNGKAAAGNKESKCEEEWRKFRESQACFAPFAKEGGGFRGEAFEHCTEIPQPDLCN
ncbi:MAG: DUF4124 domain-containing protein [Gallionella sp.]